MSINQKTKIALMLMLIITRERSVQLNLFNNFISFVAFVIENESMKRLIIICEQRGEEERQTQRGEEA